MKKIFTIGTSRRSAEDFIETLNACEIEALIDVRSFPHSKLPHFCIHDLERILNENGIRYHYLGRELGGFRKGGYDLYSQTDEFYDGIDLLEAIAMEAMSVITCAEKFPWKCHRRWISRELQRRGWIVGHIIDKGKIWMPEKK